MLTSLMIELTQYFFMIGECELDDIITNTLGSLVGYKMFQKTIIGFSEKKDDTTMDYKQGIYEKYVKRALDIICSLLAIAVFSWLYIIIAILVRVKLGSPVIFKQPRPGKNEKIFMMYKFRSMTDEKDVNGKLLPDEIRLTKFGRALRATSLDELPEAFNILKGDMSVIGPRPQLVRDMVFMTTEQRRRHSVRPGLSGLAQTRGRNAITWDAKLATDLEYIEHVTFLGDVLITINTVKQVFFKQKGQDNQEVDEVDITDDFGDYLLKMGRVGKEEYDERQSEAIAIIEELVK